MFGSWCFAFWVFPYILCPQSSVHRHERSDTGTAAAGLHHACGFLCAFLMSRVPVAGWGDNHNLFFSLFFSLFARLRVKKLRQSSGTNNLNLCFNVQCTALPFLMLLYVRLCVKCSTLINSTQYTGWTAPLHGVCQCVYTSMVCIVWLCGCMAVW